METKNGRKRTTKIGQRDKRSKSKSQPRGVGTVSESGAEYGTIQIGASRKDSDQGNSDTRGSFSNNPIPGKIVSQLVEETEKQLAYHEQQTEILRKRLNELKEINIQE
jgi:hypothetical protein